MLAAQPADVVLLDVRMPEMDGIEVAQHLQQLDQPPAVIFTTAYDAYAIRAFEVHAVDYLLKPIRLARLKEALARARTSRRCGWTRCASSRPSRAPICRSRSADASTSSRSDDIVYLKAELKYVTVRTASASI